MNIVSLGAWIQVCEAAHVPYVPAEKVVTIRKSTLLDPDSEERWEDHDHPPPEIVNFVEAQRQARQPNTMLRWDCCAPLCIKMELSDGNTDWNPIFAEPLCPYEIRTLDILMEYPDEVIPVWRRPWFKAVLHKGWPVEYRVFVEQGAIVGISNYYVQRSLLDYKPAEQELTHILTLVSALVKQVPDPKSFSADFVQLKGFGEPLFLEGGPPFSSGRTHPCCFQYREEPWDPLIALETKERPLEFSSKSASSTSGQKMLSFAPIRHGEWGSVVDVWCGGECCGSLVGQNKHPWRTNAALTRWLRLDEPLEDGDLASLKRKIRVYQS